MPLFTKAKARDVWIPGQGGQDAAHNYRPVNPGPKFDIHTEKNRKNQKAMEKIALHLLEHQITDLLRTTLIETAATLHARPDLKEKMQKSGCTFSGAFVFNDQLFTVNLGNSAVFLVSPSKRSVTKLTTEQNFKSGSTEHRDFYLGRQPGKDAVRIRTSAGTDPEDFTLNLAGSIGDMGANEHGCKHDEVRFDGGFGRIEVEVHDYNPGDYLLAVSDGYTDHLDLNDRKFADYFLYDPDTGSVRYDLLEPGKEAELSEFFTRRMKSFKTNDDITTYLVKCQEERTVLVCDGHGKDGHNVARECVNTFYHALFKKLRAKHTELKNQGHDSNTLRELLQRIRFEGDRPLTAQCLKVYGERVDVPQDRGFTQFILDHKSLFELLNKENKKKLLLLFYNPRESWSTSIDNIPALIAILDSIDIDKIKTLRFKVIIGNRIYTLSITEIITLKNVYERLLSIQHGVGCGAGGASTPDVYLLENAPSFELHFTLLANVAKLTLDRECALSKLLFKGHFQQLGEIIKYFRENMDEYQFLKQLLENQDQEKFNSEDFLRHFFRLQSTLSSWLPRYESLTSIQPCMFFDEDGLSMHFSSALRDSNLDRALILQKIKDSKELNEKLQHLISFINTFPHRDPLEAHKIKDIVRSLFLNSTSTRARYSPWSFDFKKVAKSLEVMLELAKLIQNYSPDQQCTILGLEKNLTNKAIIFLVSCLNTHPDKLEEIQLAYQVITSKDCQSSLGDWYFLLKDIRPFLAPTKNNPIVQLEISLFSAHVIFKEAKRHHSFATDEDVALYFQGRENMLFILDRCNTQFEEQKSSSETHSADQAIIAKTLQSAAHELEESQLPDFLTYLKNLHRRHFDSENFFGNDKLGEKFFDYLKVVTKLATLTTLIELFKHANGLDKIPPSAIDKHLETLTGSSPSDHFGLWKNEAFEVRKMIVVCRAKSTLGNMPMPIRGASAGAGAGAGAGP